MFFQLFFHVGSSYDLLRVETILVYSPFFIYPTVRPLSIHEERGVSTKPASTLSPNFPWRWRFLVDCRARNNANGITRTRCMPGMPWLQETLSSIKLHSRPLRPGKWSHYRDTEDKRYKPALNSSTVSGAPRESSDILVSGPPPPPPPLQREKLSQPVHIDFFNSMQMLFMVPSREFRNRPFPIYLLPDFPSAIKSYDVRWTQFLRGSHYLNG